MFTKSVEGDDIPWSHQHQQQWGCHCWGHLISLLESQRNICPSGCKEVSSLISRVTPVCRWKPSLPPWSMVQVLWKLKVVSILHFSSNTGWTGVITYIMKPKSLPLREAHLNALVQMISGERQEEEEPRSAQNIEVTEMRPVLLQYKWLFWRAWKTLCRHKWDYGPR